MRLKNHLNELFDTKMKLTNIQSGSTEFSAEFKIPVPEKITSLMAAWGQADEYSKMNPVFKFIARINNQLRAHLSRKDEITWEIIFARMDPVTGKGTTETLNDLDAKEALAVFSAVKQGLVIFIKKYKPVEFMFSAKKSEISRQKLYDKLAKIIAKQMSYDVDTIDYLKGKYYRFLSLKQIEYEKNLKDPDHDPWGNKR